MGTSLVLLVCDHDRQIKTFYLLVILVKKFGNELKVATFHPAGTMTVFSRDNLINPLAAEIFH